MKALLIIPTLAALAACGGGGDSGGAIPDVSGQYSRTSTDCPDAFDTTATVLQDGASIIFQADSSDFLDSSGTVDADGNFTLSNSQADCSGQFVDGVATASCSVTDVGECNVTYVRE